MRPRAQRSSLVERSETISLEKVCGPAATFSLTHTSNRARGKRHAHTYEARGCGILVQKRGWQNAEVLKITVFMDYSALDAVRRGAGESPARPQRGPKPRATDGRFVSCRSSWRRIRPCR